MFVYVEFRGQPKERFFFFDTGSAQKLDYRLGSACWLESPMDLPVSESPVLVLKLCATKLNFYAGAEHLR